MGKKITLLPWKRPKVAQKDLHQQLISARDEVERILIAETDLYNAAESQKTNWSNRVGKAQSRIGQVNEAGEVALHSLITQAERYVEIYTAQSATYKSRIDELIKTHEKIKDEIKRMSTMENILELEENLRLMEREVNIAVPVSGELFDAREITRMVHHARALTELKLS